MRFGLATLLLGTVSSASVIVLPYSQSFGTATAGGSTALRVAAFQAAYPELTLATADPVVTSGVLHLVTVGVGANAEAWVTPTLNYPGNNVFVSADITANNSSGTYNVGLALGSGGVNYDRIVFHPGFGGGAFRISVNAGDGANVGMGYTPGNNDPQHVQLSIAPSGLVNVTITDSANPLNVFTTSFTDARVYGADVALFRSRDDPVAGKDGQFSNFSITQVPEPSTVMLLAVGGLLTGRRVGSRRARGSVTRAGNQASVISDQ